MRSVRDCTSRWRHGWTHPRVAPAEFLIAGEFLPAYQAALGPMLAHPSVRVLGHRTDVPALMRASDVLLLPSIEEGFGLVCTEAMGSGCVPLVSQACTDCCRHLDNALVHAVGDVGVLSSHLRLLHEDRALLRALRMRTRAGPDNHLDGGRREAEPGLRRDDRGLSSVGRSPGNGRRGRTH